mgnify:FL=1
MSDEQKNLKPAKKNHPFGLYLAFGIWIGTMIGVALENIPVGVALGVLIGTSIGTAAMSQNNKK